MTVVPLDAPLSAPPGVSDAPLDSPLAPASPDAPAFANAVARAFENAGGALERADSAEKAFARGRGGLQELILERAQADVALSIASAAASRAAQSLSTILGMQV